MSKNNSSYGRLNVLKRLVNGDGVVCFLGVGGVSMSSLLALSSYFGIRTFGIDRREGEYVSELIEDGEEIVLGNAELPYDAKLLVYTLAVDEYDPIIKEAERRGVPCVSRAEYMGALTSVYRTKIAVSGSHGKSTVTAMLHSVFTLAGVNPTTLSGARLGRGKRAYCIGSLDCLLFESCEYKDSFLAFEPTLSLFLNLEYDHVDYFLSIEQLADSFLAAAKKAGRAIINIDDEKLREISKKLYTPPITVGKIDEAEYRYEPICTRPHGVSAKLFKRDEYIGDISLGVIGEFNITNAVMACVAAMECGIEFDVCRRALSNFSGIPTRLEKIGMWRTRALYFDYAHHPTEISEGIKAIKSDTGGDLTVVFGPHTFSRTKALADSFAAALSLADNLLITEIDAVRETDDGSVSSEILASKCGGKVIRTESELESGLCALRGAIAVMGAADLDWVKKFFLKY